MEYLLNVQKAIAQTEDISLLSGVKYIDGWIEAGEDLTYGIGLGSEHAVMQTIGYWINPNGCPFLDAATLIDLNDEGDKGYHGRMNEIYKLIIEQEKGDE